MAGLIGIAATAAIVLFLTLDHDAGSPGSASALLPATHTPTTAATPTATPLPRVWLDALTPTASSAPLLLSCFDGNGDGRLDGDDGDSFAGLAIDLIDGKACIDPAQHADFYAETSISPTSGECGNTTTASALIVVIASAGSDLKDASAGESLGLLHTTDEIRARTSAARVSTDAVLASPAMFGADPPQDSMERWIERVISQRLETDSCLRVVLIGHSHGGVTVTSVTAALDGAYPGRLFGVLIDRSIALYDRDATELPARVPLLNIFQTNEGWHGVGIDQPNIINVDASSEHAPIAPSDGGGGLALVTHKTLDDAPGVQTRIVDSVLAWLRTP